MAEDFQIGDYVYIKNSGEAGVITEISPKGDYVISTEANTKLRIFSSEWLLYLKPSGNEKYEDYLATVKDVNAFIIRKRIIHPRKQNRFGDLKLFLSSEDQEYISYLGAKIDSLQATLEKQGETFQDMLFRIIDEKGLKDREIYNRAYIDRKYFSKIRAGRIPQRHTVMALCLALHLNNENAEKLMRKAGYGFSNAEITDLIVQYCLVHEIYDLDAVNALLNTFKEKSLRNPF